MRTAGMALCELSAHARGFDWNDPLGLNQSGCAILHSSAANEFKNREFNVYPFKLTGRIL